MPLPHRLAQLVARGGVPQLARDRPTDPEPDVATGWAVEEPQLQRAAGHDQQDELRIKAHWHLRPRAQIARWHSATTPARIERVPGFTGSSSLAQKCGGSIAG